LLDYSENERIHNILKGFYRKPSKGRVFSRIEKEHLESFAGREDLKIFKVYQDNGISGYTQDRPALKELLKDAKDKKFDLVSRLLQDFVLRNDTRVAWLLKWFAGALLSLQ